MGRMNKCCQQPGNAQIIHSTKPGVPWRVICVYCGLIIHNNEEEGKN